MDALSLHQLFLQRVPFERPPARAQEALSSLKEWDFVEGDRPQQEYQECFDLPAHREDPLRKERMERAIVQMEAFARTESSARFSVEKVEALQCLVLGKRAKFRTTDAFAHAGEHKYAWFPGLEALWEERLGFWNSFAGASVCGAVGVYLDVLFLHPFENGNARLARLLLGWTLLRSRTWSPSLIDLVRMEKRAGSEEDYWRLVTVCAWSANARARRWAHKNGVNSGFGKH